MARASFGVVMAVALGAAALAQDGPKEAPPTESPEFDLAAEAKVAAKRLGARIETLAVVAKREKVERAPLLVAALENQSARSVNVVAVAAAIRDELKTNVRLAPRVFNEGEEREGELLVIGTWKELGRVRDPQGRKLTSCYLILDVVDPQAKEILATLVDEVAVLDQKRVDPKEQDAVAEKLWADGGLGPRELRASADRLAATAGEPGKARPLVAPGQVVNKTSEHLNTSIVQDLARERLLAKGYRFRKPGKSEKPADLVLSGEIASKVERTETTRTTTYSIKLQLVTPDGDAKFAVDDTHVKVRGIAPR